MTTGMFKEYFSDGAAAAAACSNGSKVLVRTKGEIVLTRYVSAILSVQMRSPQVSGGKRPALLMSRVKPSAPTMDETWAATASYVSCLITSEAKTTCKSYCCFTFLLLHSLNYYRGQ